MPRPTDALLALFDHGDPSDLAADLADVLACLRSRLALGYPSWLERDLLHDPATRHRVIVALSLDLGDHVGDAVYRIAQRRDELEAWHAAQAVSRLSD